MTNAARSFGVGVVVLSLVGCSEAPKTALQQARAFHRNAQWTESITCCDAHLATSPDDGEALLIRGQSNLALNKLDLALTDLNRAIELAPDDPEPLYLCARVYRKMGEDELAFQDRDRALMRDTTRDAAYEYAPSNFAAKVELTPPSDSDSEPVEENEPPEPPDLPEPYEPAGVFAEDSGQSIHEEVGPTEASEWASSGQGPASGQGSASGQGPTSGQGGETGTTAGSPSSRVLSGQQFGGRLTQTTSERNAERSSAANQVQEKNDGADPLARREQETVLRPSRYDRSNPVLSTALPPSSVGSTILQPGIPGGSSEAATTSPLVPRANQREYGLPQAGGHTATTGIQSTPRSAAVPPTGRSTNTRLSTGLVAPNGTALPTQLAPTSPYRLHGNPIPGQTPTPLTTSLRPNEPASPAARPPGAPQRARSAPKVQLSTALPAEKASGS